MQAHERENARYASGSINPVAQEEEVMFSLLPPPAPGATLLDIGCGIGTISGILRSKGFAVTGIDFSSVAVDMAKASGIKAECVDVDAGGLPFPDHSFDVVWAGDVIEHVFDPIGLFEESARVLKPGGWMLLTVPNDLGLAARARIAMTGSSPHLHIYKHYRQNKHHSLFSYDMLQFMLKSAGLKERKFASIIARLGNRVVHDHLTGQLLGKVFIVAAQRA